MHDHPNMAELMAKELSHPFHKDPVAYLDSHPEIEEQAFRPSPVRIIRTAGSGILKDPDQWVDQIVDFVRALEKENGDGQPIEVEMTAHDTCGAGALKRPGQKNTDDLAHADIDGLTAKLVQKGIKAVCPKKRAPMNGLSVHNALGVTIDCTPDCRMQNPPFNSFALSSPDKKAIPGEAGTAVSISAKPVEQGGHSYGILLKETQAPYTTLVYGDTARPELAQTMLRGIEQPLAAHRANGVNTRVITRKAPKVTQRVPVRKVIIICMDERCNVRG